MPFNHLARSISNSFRAKAVKPKSRKAKPGSVSDRFRKLRAFSSAGQAMLREQVGHSACHLWFTLWTHENAKAGTVSIGRRKLATIMGCDDSAIKRLTKSLLDLGYLERIQDGVIGKTASVYILNPLPISQPNGGTRVPPVQKARGGAGDPKEGVQVPPIQSSTKTVSGDGASAVRCAAFAASLPSAGSMRPSSAPERKTPEVWLRELLRAAGGTLPESTVNQAAEKPGGPGFREAENLICSRHPSFKYSRCDIAKKSFITLVEDQPQ